MALELVWMDSATLPGIADAIRAKKGDSALLLPSRMAAAIGGIKNLRVETGTIIPAEATKSITIPCRSGAKAVCLEADAATISAVEGQAKTRYVTSVLANFCGKITGATNAAMYIWNLTKYADSGVHADNANGFYISSSMNFYPATYRWVAYYWEDAA